MAMSYPQNLLHLSIHCKHSKDTSGILAAMLDSPEQVSRLRRAFSGHITVLFINGATTFTVSYEFS